jgi:hypothetical protein
MPRTLAVSLLLAGACSSDSGGADSGTDSDAGTATDSGGTTTGAMGSTSGGSTGSGPMCPLGDKMFKFSLDLPPADPPLDPLSGTDSRVATCAIDDVSTAGQEMTASMTCSEGGVSGQAYVLKVTLPEGDSVSLTTGNAVVIWTNWWEDGVGTRQRLAVRVGENVVLAVYMDSIGGGTAGNCLDPMDPPRAEAQGWLGDFGATIMDPACDDLGTYGLDLGSVDILPGETSNVTALEQSMNVLLGNASCFVPDGTSELWTMEFIAWVPG